MGICMCLCVNWKLLCILDGIQTKNSPTDRQRTMWIFNESLLLSIYMYNNQSDNTNPHIILSNSFWSGNWNAVDGNTWVHFKIDILHTSYILTLMRRNCGNNVEEESEIEGGEEEKREKRCRSAFRIWSHFILIFTPIIWSWVAAYLVDIRFYLISSKCVNFRLFLLSSISFSNICGYINVNIRKDDSNWTDLLQ